MIRDVEDADICRKKGKMTRKIYVASSWRNEYYPDVVGKVEGGRTLAYLFCHAAEVLILKQDGLQAEGN